MATHDSNIQISIALDAATAALFGFTPMHVAEIAILTVPERVRAYASAKEVDADGDISTTAKDALKAHFAQTKRPGLVKLGVKDAAETWVEALTAIETVDDNWYGLTCDTRLSADIALISGWVEARTKIFVAQSSEADWLAAGTTLPTGLTGLATSERTAVLFHDTNTEPADCAWLANRLVFNPDTFSAPWDAAIQGVAPYASGITTGQRLAAMSKNCNLMLPYGGALTFIDAGVNLTGRPIYEVVSADWFKIRLEAKIAQAKINASARGEKIPLGAQGVSILRPLVESQFSEGEAAGHFVPGQTLVDFISPTAADIAAQRIRATGRAQLSVGARIFEFDFNFQRTAVNEEEA